MRRYVDIEASELTSKETIAEAWGNITVYKVEHNACGSRGTHVNNELW